jgi:F-type H+-transporting ATPase subunit b
MFLLPDVGTIFWVSIIFGITIILLAKYAWKPLIAILNEREKSISDALKAAKEAELKINSLKSEQERIVKKTQLEKERIIREGNDQRELIIEEANKKAQKETERMISEARTLIGREREKALLEIKTQIASLSIEIATKIIYAEMEDKERHEKMIEKLIEKIDLN